MKKEINQEQLYQTKNIYACANIEGEIEKVFYMVMDSKNEKNYLLVDNGLEEIPMNQDDYTYMPIHMGIYDLIDIYNHFCKSVDKGFQPLKIKTELTKTELISLVYFLDPLLHDSFLHVARTIKQSKEESYCPVKKKVLEHK